MSIKDGGPVPLTFADVIGRQREDYAEAARLRKEELRDHFAGLAMAGMLAREYLKPREVADDAYGYADAMIAAREQRT